jgi:hypothetical protein
MLGWATIVTETQLSDHRRPRHQRPAAPERTSMQKLRFVAILAVLLAMTGAALAQASKPSGKRVAPLDLQALYLQAIGEEGGPTPLDPSRLAAARAWVDALDLILLVDQEILGSARQTAEVLYQTNKDKHKNVRNFSEHEITPYLFKNSDKFRDVFAMAIADTMTVDEIKQLAAAGRLGPQDPLAGKTQDAGKKFDKIASFLAGALVAQMIETTNFSAYGLNLTLPTASQ